MIATHIFCSAGANLEIINIEDPANPFHVGKLEIADTTFPGITVLGYKCYMTSKTTNRLYIIDIRDLENPILESTMETGDGSGIETRGAAYIGSYGNFVYFAGDTGLPGDDTGYVQVLDVSTDIPTVRGIVSSKYASKSRGAIVRYYPDTDSTYIFISSNYTAAPFSSDYGCLSSFEVTDPDNPVYRTRWGNIYVYGGFTSGQLIESNDRIYVNEYGAQDWGYCFNISNPNSIVRLGTIRNQPTNCRCVAAIEEYSFCFVDNSMYIIDYTTVGVPAYLGRVNDGDQGGLVTLDAPRNAQVNNNYIYVSSYDDDALWIGDVSDPNNVTHVARVDNGDGGAELEFVFGFTFGEFIWNAAFSGVPLDGVSPLTVQFTDLSTSTLAIQSWLWDFGDGNTSTEQNPTHIYERPGKYTVSLTIR